MAVGEVEVRAFLAVAKHAYPTALRRSRVVDFEIVQIVVVPTKSAMFAVDNEVVRVLGSPRVTRAMERSDRPAGKREERVGRVVDLDGEPVRVVVFDNSLRTRLFDTQRHFFRKNFTFLNMRRLKSQDFDRTHARLEIEHV